jgi:hypothetical protein
VHDDWDRLIDVSVGNRRDYADHEDVGGFDSAVYDSGHDVVVESRNWRRGVIQQHAEFVAGDIVATTGQQDRLRYDSGS